MYEASFLKYHKGTPRVPGEANWPGAQKDYNKGFSVNIDTEIAFFLDQAMGASKEVADKISLTPNSSKTNPSGEAFAGWNSYFEMFSDVDMGKYPEVIFWRAYSGEFGTHAVSTYIRIGGNMGVTKSMVDGFLMKNGLPIYATAAGYQGDQTIMKMKENRDERLQLFIFGETDRLINEPIKDSNPLKFPEFSYPNIIDQVDHRDPLGYRVRKCYTYDPKQATATGQASVYGSIVYRAAEAYLNYIEASYLKTGVIDNDATKYWTQLRTRAGVDPDFSKTITATDLSMEGDWAKYSGDNLVDKTLFNIRRERRNELMSEGLRMNDLKRWRALDKVQNYIVEGFNLWDEAYKAPRYFGSDGKTLLIADGTPTANISSKSLSKYIRPFQKFETNNLVYNGLNWSKANYLSPIGVRDLQLASPSQTDAAASTIYQNPYWPITQGSATE